MRIPSIEVDSGLTVGLRMVNWSGKTSSVNSVFWSWFLLKLYHGRPWVEAMGSTCGAVGVIGWVSTDGLISTIEKL